MTYQCRFLHRVYSVEQQHRGSPKKVRVMFLFLTAVGTGQNLRPVPAIAVAIKKNGG
jgi:hypothetical protein